MFTNSKLQLIAQRVRSFRHQLQRMLTVWTLDNSRIRQLADCQLADWTSRGLVNSRTRRCRQKERKLSTQSRRWHPRVDQSASRPVRELAFRELAYPRVVQ